MTISIHALRGEGDFLYFFERGCKYEHFNPRPPWGGRQSEMFKILEIMGISIHALRGEGDHGRVESLQAAETISIHALRGEGDSNYRQFFHMSGNISIHALRGEGDYSIVGYLPVK